MGNIRVLDSHLSDMIAAGEVVERPASVVKELAENAIDAGAGRITVEIKKGGIELIRMTDDGSGFHREDLPTAFLRHATSKISTPADLYNIRTMGFRGEALASIAAVSSVDIITKRKEDTFGSVISANAGEIGEVSDSGCPDGTTVFVRNLFSNIPARMKFLKKDSAEASAVQDAVIWMALGNPSVSFKLISDGKEKLSTPGNGDLKSCIYAIYGGEYSANIKEISYDGEGLSVYGYCGTESLTRSTRGYQTFFVNGRYFKSRSVTCSLEQAYQDGIMKGKHPFAVINIKIDPMFCDVNVHPSKTEVKFSNEKAVTSAVYWGVKNAVFSSYEAVSDKNETKKQEFLWELHDNPFIPEVKKEDELPEITYRRSGVSHGSFKRYETKETPKAYTEIKPPVKEAVQEQFISDKTYPDVKIVGQLFDTYIVAEAENEMWLIDQHAAHERLNFERLKAEREHGSVISQSLLAPVIAEFTGEEFYEIQEVSEELSRLGFEAEIFGDNSYIVRAVPSVGGDPETLFRETASILCKTGGAQNRGDAESEALYSLACHSSIRANKALSMREMQKMLEDLENIPHTCPHGRPVKTVLSKREIEKMFKRIV